MNGVISAQTQEIKRSFIKESAVWHIARLLCDLARNENQLSKKQVETFVMQNLEEYKFNPNTVKRYLSAVFVNSPKKSLQQNHAKLYNTITVKDNTCQFNQHVIQEILQDNDFVVFNPASCTPALHLPTVQISVNQDHDSWKGVNRYVSSDVFKMVGRVFCEEVYSGMGVTCQYLDAMINLTYSRLAQNFDFSYDLVCSAFRAMTLNAPDKTTHVELYPFIGLLQVEGKQYRVNEAEIKIFCQENGWKLKVDNAKKRKSLS